MNNSEQMHKPEVNVSLKNNFIKSPKWYRNVKKKLQKMFGQ